MNDLPEIVCALVVYIDDGHEEFVPLQEYVRNPVPGTYMIHPCKRPLWRSAEINCSWYYSQLTR